MKEKLEIVRVDRSAATNTYVVRLSDSTKLWTDGQLISACADGTVYFGGRVSRRKGKRTSTMYAQVCVYVD